MHLSVRPPIHPPAHLSIHPFNRLSIHLQPAGHPSTHPSIRSLSLHSLVHHPFIPLTVHSSVHTPSCPPTHEAIYPRTQRLCTFLTFHVSADFLKRASTHPSTHPTTYLSVHVNRRLSVHSAIHSYAPFIQVSDRPFVHPVSQPTGTCNHRPVSHPTVLQGTGRGRTLSTPWGHGRLWGAAPSQSGGRSQEHATPLRGLRRSRGPVCPSCRP